MRRGLACLPAAALLLLSGCAAPSLTGLLPYAR